LLKVLVALIPDSKFYGQDAHAVVCLPPFFNSFQHHLYFLGGIRLHERLVVDLGHVYLVHEFWIAIFGIKDEYVNMFLMNEKQY